VESPVMVLQEEAPVPISTGTTILKKEGVLNQVEEGHQPPPVRPYQPPVPYPQKLAWAKLSELQPWFAQFIDILRWVYVESEST